MGYNLLPHQLKAEPLLTSGSAVLWWEMRTMKTRTILHAYNQLVDAGTISDLVVVASTTYRSVWKEEAEDEMKLGIPIVDLRTTDVRKHSAKLSLPPPDWPCIFILNPEILQHWQPWLQMHLRTG